MGVMFEDAALARAVREEYRRLAGPESQLLGVPRWRKSLALAGLVRSSAAGLQHGAGCQPDAQAAGALCSAWLPIESQL
jgi:hypothetical protein